MRAPQNPLLAAVLALVAVTSLFPPPAAAETTWLADFDAALREARTTQRPLLLRFGGEGCVWCRKLQADLANDQSGQLKAWTCVELDVDRDSAAAARFAVTAIPALRIVSPRGRLVATHDGYLPPEEFGQWLSDNREAATSTADALLLAAGEPSLLEVVRLVRYLEQRDAVLREAAVNRLLPYPQAASAAVVKVLREGSLASQLAALEILQHWEAPLEELDPWRPETLTEERLAALDVWREALPTADEEAVPLAPRELAAAEEELQQLLKAEDAETSAIRERLARYGEPLRPRVLALLQQAETDRDRERLLALRYRLSAPATFVLEYPGLLERLADRAAEMRRRAVEELATAANSEIQPLLLELFSDPDPLVRELSLRGLRNVGGPQATSALADLLDDPEPNVRAAVMKQLAEDASEEMLLPVSEYLKREQDPDLIVHAVRYLRELPSETAYNSLQPLLRHESWQVRAEAAEAIGKFRSEFVNGENAPLVADIYDELLALLEDEDPFVVSRAVAGLEDINAERAVAPLVAAIGRHPSLAPSIVDLLGSGSEMQPLSMEPLREFFAQGEPAVRAAAIGGLIKAHSDQLAEEIPAALADEESQVRVAAAQAFLQYLGEEHPGATGQLLDSPSLTIEPPRIVLDEPQAGTSSVLGEVFGGLFRALSGSPQPPRMDPNDLPQAAAPEKPADQAIVPEPPLAEQPAESPADDLEEEAEDLARPSPMEIWLEELYEGKHRPEWTAELVAPLRTMTQAELPLERAVAALALVPLGDSELALPILRNEARQSPEAFVLASQVLRWLPWEKRMEIFRELADSDSGGSQLEQLIYALNETPDPRAAAEIWRLLDREPENHSLASAANYALQQSLFGERYYDISSLTAKQREAAAGELRPRAAEGPLLKRMLAITLLAKIEADEAEQLARQILQDTESEQPLKTDAFQIVLSMLQGTERDKFAVESLGDASLPLPQQRIALKYLAMGDQSLYMLSQSKLTLDLSNLVTIYGSTSGQPIIPEPPEGLQQEAVAPFLKHDDPEVAACAGYLLALFGEREGLAPLVGYWQSSAADDALDRLVYRAIAVLDDSSSIDHLKTIYQRLDSYSKSEFYWTIRIMSGPPILEFRKQIRDEVGVENLR